MKAAMVTLLGFLLGACSMGNDHAQIAALQKQIAALSQQVHTADARAAAAGSLDLQRKCAVDAKRTFEMLGYSYDKTSDRDSVWFASHYNPDAKRCFMLITHYNLGSGVTVEDLLDANEQMGYATLMGTRAGLVRCETNLSTKSLSCKSQQQFDQYVAHYMGGVPRS